MGSEANKNQKRQYLAGALGLGFIFTAVWAVLLIFVPASPVLTIIDYIMYVMSVFLIALPGNSVLGLYLTRRHIQVVLAAAVWVFWTFGIRFFLMWLLGMIITT
jgi:hypothetical protein